MEQVDFPRFRAVMAGMAKVYEREIDGPLLDAYWLALRAWSLVDFEAAAGHLMATSEFMPRPAAFTALRKAGRPTPAEAWAKAVASCKTAWTPQGYVGGTSGDPHIDAAVRGLGGYSAIAMCDTDKLPFLERRFCEHYETVQDATETREALPLIASKTGLHPLIGHDA